MQSFITTLIMAAGVSGASIQRQAAAVSFTDTYDALQTGSSVGLLHALEYSGAIVRERILPNGTQPIIPHSLPKFAEGTTKLAHMQTGGVSFDSYIHMDAGQNVSSFDLYSFYFACAAIDGTAYGPARPCTVAVSGLGDGTRKYTSTFDYTPSSPDEAPFVKAQFNYPDFRQIQNVSFGIVTGSAPAGTTALAIDSLEHINYA